MDITDRKRDRDRPATGFGGIFSAALVSRYLLAVFAAFVLADAAISTALPRYNHAEHAEAGGAAARRRCHFGTQARPLVLSSTVFQFSTRRRLCPLPVKPLRAGHGMASC